MKIKSFGCSFIYGSDLPLAEVDMHGDCLLSVYDGFAHNTWPKLLAKHYNTAYENHARPGIGNLRILEQICSQAHLTESAYFIINWTWQDRFDYIQPDSERWETLRPDGETALHSIYYRQIYNQYYTMITNVNYIATAIHVLTHKKIPFYMTLMDLTVFDVIDPNWQDPSALTVLQKIIKPYINWFDELDFLTWSQNQGFPVSAGWHPLEQAHQAAANYIIEVFDKQKISNYWSTFK